MIYLEYSNNCPECSSNLIHDYAKGEFLCQNCGYVVLDEVNDLGPESLSRDFEEKYKNTRASGATSYSQHDFGLRTEIDNSAKDFGGKTINSHMNDHVSSLRRWHNRIRVSSSKERRLSNVLTKINETCSSLSLPKTLLETAAMIYRNYEKNNEAKGKSVSCIAAATIYLACKRCSVIRSLDEIVKATGCSSGEKSNLKLASKYYRKIVMDLGTYKEDSRNFSLRTQTTFENSRNNVSVFPKNDCSNEMMNNDYGGPKNPLYLNKQNGLYYSSNHDQLDTTQKQSINQYIAKLTNLAKLDTKIERLAIDLSNKTVNHSLSDGKSPNGIAAAYLYLSAVILGINLLQIDVSGLAGVTEVTIRNRCKEILCSSKLLITVNPQNR